MDYLQPHQRDLWNHHGQHIQKASGTSLNGITEVTQIQSGLQDASKDKGQEDQGQTWAHQFPGEYKGYSYPSHQSIQGEAVKPSSPLLLNSRSLASKWPPPPTSFPLYTAPPPSMPLDYSSSTNLRKHPILAKRYQATSTNHSQMFHGNSGCLKSSQQHFQGDAVNTLSPLLLSPNCLLSAMPPPPTSLPLQTTPAPPMPRRNPPQQCASNSYVRKHPILEKRYGSSSTNQHLQDVHDSQVSHGNSECLKSSQQTFQRDAGTPLLLNSKSLPSALPPAPTSFPLQKTPAPPMPPQNPPQQCASNSYVRKHPILEKRYGSSSTNQHLKDVHDSQVSHDNSGCLKSSQQTFQEDAGHIPPPPLLNPNNLPASAMPPAPITIPLQTSPAHSIPRQNPPQECASNSYVRKHPILARRYGSTSGNQQSQEMSLSELSHSKRGYLKSRQQTVQGDAGHTPSPLLLNPASLLSAIPPVPTSFPREMTPEPSVPPGTKNPILARRCDPSSADQDSQEVNTSHVSNRNSGFLEPSRQLFQADEVKGPPPLLLNPESVAATMLPVPASFPLDTAPTPSVPLKYSPLEYATYSNLRQHPILARRHKSLSNGQNSYGIATGRTTSQQFPHCYGEWPDSSQVMETKDILPSNESKTSEPAPLPEQQNEETEAGSPIPPLLLNPESLPLRVPPLQNSITLNKIPRTYMPLPYSALGYTPHSNLRQDPILDKPYQPYSIGNRSQKASHSQPSVLHSPRGDNKWSDFSQSKVMEECYGTKYAPPSYESETNKQPPPEQTDGYLSWKQKETDNEASSLLLNPQSIASVVPAVPNSFPLYTVPPPSRPLQYSPSESASYLSLRQHPILSKRHQSSKQNNIQEMGSQTSKAFYLPSQPLERGKGLSAQWLNNTNHASTTPLPSTSFPPPQMNLVPKPMTHPGFFHGPPVSNSAVGQGYVSPSTVLTKEQTDERDGQGGLFSRIWGSVKSIFTFH